MAQGIEVSTYTDGKLKQSDAKVTVVIDNQTYKVPFGTHLIPVASGPHKVSIYWRGHRHGPGVEVIVPSRGVAKIRWDSPRWIGQHGRMSVLD